MAAVVLQSQTCLEPASDSRQDCMPLHLSPAISTRSIAIQHVTRGHTATMVAVQGEQNETRMLRWEHELFSKKTRPYPQQNEAFMTLPA